MDLFDEEGEGVGEGEGVDVDVESVFKLLLDHGISLLIPLEWMLD
jgi:hypothetical protein